MLCNCNKPDKLFDFASMHLIHKEKEKKTTKPISEFNNNNNKIYFYLENACKMLVLIIEEFLKIYMPDFFSPKSHNNLHTLNLCIKREMEGEEK